MIFAFASGGLQYCNTPRLLTFVFYAVGGCILVILFFIVTTYIKLKPSLESTEFRVPGFPWIPYAVILGLLLIVLLMLFDPSARGQLIAVAVIAGGLTIVSLLMPNSRTKV